VIPINENYHVGIAIRKVSKLAEELGFSEKELSEISIVVSELANNLIEHEAIEGKIICSLNEEGTKKYIQIISEDKGPGIANVETVMEDGFSTSGTLGIGLGAIKRLMSDFRINSNIDDVKTAKNNNNWRKIGTKIITKKYLSQREDRVDISQSRTRFGVFTRSKYGEKYNGDNYFLQHFEDKTIAAVIDGLGHGQYAFEASTEARLYFTKNYKKPLDVIINDLHARLKGTRGVVISIALIDHKEGVLEYIGIGNVLTKIFNSTTTINPLKYAGFLGYKLRNFRLIRYPWIKGNIIIMTSDGISERYVTNKDPNFLKKHPIVIASTILKEYGKTQDDATVLVGG
jgi:anti-sigma regulatory factor (Ser/Thr protein kinase)